MKTSPTPADARSHDARHALERGECGAALIMALLLTTLLLAAGGALILTTSMAATTAVDATAEMQAYYAAEAGLEASLAVLRRNVASNTSPALSPTSSHSTSPRRSCAAEGAATPPSSPARWCTRAAPARSFGAGSAARCSPPSWSRTIEHGSASAA